MDGAKLDRFIDDAKSLTQTRNAQATRKFGLGSHARYHLDLASHTLTFFDPSDAPAMATRIVPVGSLANASHSWLWSWENESIPQQASKAMLAIRSFGKEHDIAALERGFSPCDDALAWALAAISLKLLGAQGTYRIDQARTQLFLLLFDLERIVDKPN